MITIVTYFRSKVVKFIFGGRNSGQSRNEEHTLPSYDASKRKASLEPDCKILICGLGIMTYHIF